jgi:prepilin-type N-terminal cleavage/methylation domain-containing protein/prepilin-type processing-associated H-X9-DG protein
MRKDGFTLIELLVVIAIIAILAAIIFPVFATAREKARQSSCLSNEKQIGLALMQYCQDYDEFFTGGANPYGDGCGWAGTLYPYIKTASVFICPSDTSAKNNQLISYSYNTDFARPALQNFPNGFIPLSLAKLNAASRTVVIAEVANATPFDITTDIAGALSKSPEGNGYGVSYNPYGVVDPDKVLYATGYLHNSNPAGTAHFTGPLGRHSNGSNFVLADGHAKWFMPGAVSAGYAAASSKNPPSSNLACGTEYGDPTIAATFSPM